jgi:glycine betaine/proline transport system substrate-binding protein
VKLLVWGAGIHANTVKAIDLYGLDYEQITSSGPAMVASLDKAIRDKEWIVVTGWKPHFKWSQNDLKYLKDPKGVYPKDACTIILEEDLKQINLRLLLFKNFNLEEGQLADLMTIILKTREKQEQKNGMKPIKFWLTLG